MLSKKENTRVSRQTLLATSMTWHKLAIVSKTVALSLQKSRLRYAFQLAGGAFFFFNTAGLEHAPDMRTLFHVNLDVSQRSRCTKPPRLSTEN